MRPGPSGKVVCCICRKWLDRNAAVGVNGKHMHVQKCFAVGLDRLAAALAIRDRIEFAVMVAFKAGQRGDVRL